MEAVSTQNWIGRTLGGRYQILEAIGEGGMGIIYRAKQLSVDREVAIKMMHNRAAQDPTWTERFRSEANACSQLTHPNTIRLYDFGQTTLGNFYMVMELLRGRSLSDVIRQEAPMPAAKVLRIVMQCCASLSEAHNAGIIHRDIKPDNMFQIDLPGTSDFIKVFDFSIAKQVDVMMTAAGVIMGTPQFMSPEQGRGEEIDHRSDIYSLGIVMYLMLTKVLPFNAADPIEVLQMHQNLDVPPLPDYVPNSVALLVTSCLQKSPDKRPHSALALLEAAKVWLTHIDPNLDVSTDPVLKNTIIDESSFEVALQEASPNSQTKSSYKKTLLVGSGASAALRHTPAPPLASPLLVNPRPSELQASTSSSISAPSISAPSKQPGQKQQNNSALTRPEFSHSPPQAPKSAAQSPKARAKVLQSPDLLDASSALFTSRLSFVVACILIALICSVGAYFITSSLR